MEGLMSGHLFELVLGRLHEGGVEGPSDRQGGYLHGPLGSCQCLHFSQHLPVSGNDPSLHSMTHVNVPTAGIAPLAGTIWWA